MEYGRSGAWARIAQQDAQQLLDAIEAPSAEPRPPVLRLAGTAADRDGRQA
jgi:hypothetical protein